MSDYPTTALDEAPDASPLTTATPGSRDRFGFGANWTRFLATLTEQRIATAQQSMVKILDRPSLAGCSVLDIGSGSGLFSLAAKRLGADRVHSFDFDPESVRCTAELKRRYFPDDPTWTVEHGSVLDTAYLRELGTFDIVYSWGVLHHTGAMWQAIAAAMSTVAPGGTLAVALYNDQGVRSRYWYGVKRIANTGPIGRYAMLGLHIPFLYGARWLVRALTGRLKVERGMSLWFDMHDWIGGFPFEVAMANHVRWFCEGRGFAQVRQHLTTRSGCNEFVFRRP